ANGNWTRNYSYEENTNRLVQTQVGGQTYDYPHHREHGFINALPHLQVMQWNFKDELQAVAKQNIQGEIPETTYYVYDASGQRIRKVTEHQGGASKKSERLYLGGIEIYKQHSGAYSGLERTTLHIMDDTRRIAMIDSRNDINDESDKRTVRFQLSNHLGSASLELNNGGELISYEEYHPYGTTAYQAVNASIKAVAKRYRYTGMERDEETGLNYHGARYYISWLGRWLKYDTGGLIDGINLYQYSFNNPIILTDTNGFKANPPSQNFDETVAIITEQFSNYDGDYTLSFDSYEEDGYKVGQINIQTQWGQTTLNYNNGAWTHSSIYYGNGELSGGTVSGEGLPMEFQGYQLPEVTIEAEAIKEESSSIWGSVLDGVQIGLDVLGFVPLFGEVADGINGLISLARGNYVDATLSFAAMIPFGGWGATAGKWGRKIYKHSDELIAGGKKVMDWITGPLKKPSPLTPPINKSDDVFEEFISPGVKSKDQPLNGANKVKGKGINSFKFAGRFGIDTYNNLRKKTKGKNLGVQVHHLFEKRFASTLNQKQGDMLSIVLTPDEHKVFTKAWRNAIPYGKGTANASPQLIHNVARQIYSDYPEILKALNL
ncbi:MAG: RHS repeat-associated core domain-containing protein, partial [Bacteroidota bacterium]